MKQFNFPNKVLRTFFFSFEGFYLHAIRGVAKQASKSDCVGDRAQVDE